MAWINRNFPQNSKRGEFLRLTKLGLYVLHNEGIRAVIRNTKIYVNLYGAKNIILFKLNTKDSELEDYENNIATTKYFLKILKREKNPNLIIPKVDIIIPIYNAYDYVVKCVDSVIESSDNCRLILIDDASTDKRILEFLNKLSIKKKNIELIILKNEKNIGFVKTVNKAHGFVKNHFVILNSDTEVPPGWLNRLFMPIFKNENKVASVTPFANSTTIFSFPNFHEDGPLFKGLSVNKIDSYFDRYGLPLHIDVPSGGGFCIAINKEVSKSLGLFDEIFDKGYGEENDWCLRAKKRGFRNVVATNLFIYHKHGTSFLNEEKKILQRQNSKKLQKRYPKYNEDVQKFIKKDSLKPIRDILNIIIDTKTRNEKKLILVIDHNLGGGSHVISSNLSKELGNTQQVIHLKFDIKQKNLIFSYHGFTEKNLSLLNVDPCDLVNKIISFFEIDYIIINQLVTWELFKILEIIKQKEIKYLVYLHDYFLICPNWNLIDFNGKYCGVPNISKCQTCLDSSSTRYNDFKFYYTTEKFYINTWRERNFEFLKNADEIISPSESCKKEFLKAYPGLKIKVLENFVPLQKLISRKDISYKNKKYLSVGIIGNMKHVKGSEIIKEILNHPDFEKLEVKIVLLGCNIEKITCKIKNKFFIHGEFENNDLPNLLEKYNIDLVFIPSITPETFSFTTAEAQILGYPVICFDLGSPAERIKKYNSGIIVNEISADAVIKKFKEILSNPQIIEKCNKNTKILKSFSVADHVSNIETKLK